MTYPNEYDVVFRRCDGLIASKGPMRYRLVYRRPDEDTERTVNTRGYLMPDVMALVPGDRVDLIRDGRGSVIHINRNNPES